MPEKKYIVQIGSDEDVFDENAAQDSRARQLSYGLYLKKQSKDLHLINIVITDKTNFKEETVNNVTFLPCIHYRFRQMLLLVHLLKKIHQQNRIVLVTTQDVHGVYWAGILFSRFTGVPVIGQIHYDLSSKYARDEWFVEPYGKYYEKVVLFSVRYFYGIRVVNSATEEYLKNINYKGRVSICPVPVTTFSIDSNLMPQGWRYSDALHVLYVGRFVRFKNLTCWLEAAKCALLVNENIEFTLIGDGEDRECMELLCKELGISNRVQFRGALKPQDVAAWYASADVFLLTSFYEGFGRVLIEAMNYSVVPVCTDVAGPKDIVTDGVDGYLVTSDPGLLAQRLIELEGDRGRLNDMGKNGKAMVDEKYSSDILRKRWLDFVMSFVK